MLCFTSKPVASKNVPVEVDGCLPSSYFRQLASELSFASTMPLAQHTLALASTTPRANTFPIPNLRYPF